MTRMTKQHYELIAGAVKKAKRPLCPGWTLDQVSMYDYGWVAVARHLAEDFATTNALFDRQRFLAACGVPS